MGKETTVWGLTAYRTGSTCGEIVSAIAESSRTKCQSVAEEVFNASLRPT